MYACVWVSLTFLDVHSHSVRVSQASVVSHRQLEHVAPFFQSVDRHQSLVRAGHVRRVGTTAGVSLELDVNHCTVTAKSIDHFLEMGHLHDDVI